MSRLELITMGQMKSFFSPLQSWHWYGRHVHRYRLFSDLSVNLGWHPRPVAQWIVDGDRSQRHALTLLNANSRSRFGVLTPAPVQLNLSFNPRYNDGVLRLLLVNAGDAADEAEVNIIGTDAKVHSLDIVTGGIKNHIDINTTSMLRYIRVSGSGTNYLDLGIGTVAGAHRNLSIDARGSTGQTAVFLGTYAFESLTFLGGLAPGSRTLLGLCVLGNLSLPSLSHVQGLILQKGSSGQLDLGGNGAITAVELQTSATRPGEEHAVGTLLNAPGLRSVLFAGGGDRGQQRFPGFVVSGAQTLSGSDDQLLVLYDNRGIALDPASGLSHADLLQFDGVERLCLDAMGAIGLQGSWSLPGLSGQQLREVVLRSPSKGLADLGLLTAGLAPGSLSRVDVSGIAGSVQLGVAASCLAPGAVLIGGDGGVQFRLTPAEQDGPVSVLTGAGDDLIIFGAAACSINSGAGSDRFEVAAANGGLLAGLTSLQMADSGSSDDVLQLRHAGVNDMVTGLSGSLDAVGFRQQVLQQIAEQPTASGLYVEVIATAEGAVTYGYLNSGEDRWDQVFAVLGVHNPVLSGIEISLG